MFRVLRETIVFSFALGDKTRPTRKNRRLLWWFSGKESACEQETRVQSPRWDDTLEREMATHSMDKGGWRATVLGVAKSWT